MNLGRILTAMVTPMNSALEVDFSASEDLARYLLEHGSDGIVVCGTTGESPTVTADEKIELFTRVKKAVGGRGTVVANVGTNSTEASIALAKRAEQTEVDAIMAVVPYYNKPSQEGLYQHFKAIAESTGLPVILYNVPSRTAGNMQPATVKRLAEIPNIVAIKEASGSMDQVSELKRILPADFLVYSGDDASTLPMLALGCSGIISVAAHVVGDEMKKMIDAWFAGDSATATKWHLHLYPMFKGIFMTTNPVPIKAMVNMIGLNAGGVRLPLVEADEEEKKYLTALISQIKENDL